MLKVYLIGVLVSFVALMILAMKSDFGEEKEVTEENIEGIHIAVFVVSFLLSLFSWLMCLLIIVKMIQERES